MVPGVASIFSSSLSKYGLTQVLWWLVIVRREMYAALVTHLPFTVRTRIVAR